MLHIITLLILSRGYSPNVSIAHCGYTCLHKYVITILSNPVLNKGWKKQASAFFQIKITQQLLCILTSIWVLPTSKSWLKHFFQTFPTFFVHLNLFQWFHVSNQEKMSKIQQYFLNFCLFFKAGWHANAGWLPEGLQCLDHL